MVQYSREHTRHQMQGAGEGVREKGIGGGRVDPSCYFDNPPPSYLISGLTRRDVVPLLDRI